MLEYANGAIAAFSSSLIARGSNTFTIEGERGSIVLYEPFVCAHRIGMDFSEPFASRGNAPAGSGGAAAKIKSRLKKMGLQRRLSALRVVRRYMKGRSFVFSGNGYQFELEEVMSCMRAGKSESAVMPLEDFRWPLPAPWIGSRVRGASSDHKPANLFADPQSAITHRLDVSIPRTQ